MFLGGSILSFVLPMAAFIVIAGGLFWLYRRPHRNPRLNYMTPEVVTSVGTLEPGPVPVPVPAATAPATAQAAATETVVPEETLVPETVTPETEVAEAKAEGPVIDSETEGKEGTE
jgi:hypothetical protein